MPGKKSKTESSRSLTLPTKRRDVPATVGLVTDVRNELKADFRSLDSKVEAGFKQMESRFKEQDSKIEEIRSSVHRIEALVEEQHSENRIMLEALNGFVQRMDRIEKRQDDADTTLRLLAKSRGQ
jgi:methyl-accepting chemotaxis protein